MKAGLLDHLLYAVMEALAVAFFQAGTGDSLCRIFRVKVIRLPLHIRAVPALQPCRPFQADIAKRSYVVAPNVDRGPVGRLVFHIYYCTPGGDPSNIGRSIHELHPDDLRDRDGLPAGNPPRGFMWPGRRWTAYGSWRSLFKGRQASDRIPAF